MYRVMIVDDEYIIRQGIVSLIDWEELGCEIIKEADNGDEAYLYLKENPVDIIVCDIRMPGKNGLEVAEAIQRENIPVKVIFLTAYSEFEYARMAMRFGVRDYVVKTDYIEKLPDTVRRVISELKAEQQRRSELKSINDKLSSSIQLLQEKLLGDVIGGTIQEEKEIVSRADGCQFPVFPFFLADFIVSQKDLEAIPDEKRERTQRAVRNFINLSLGEYDVCTAAISRSDFVTVIFKKDKKTVDSIFASRLKEMLSNLRTMLRETLHISVHICLSKKCEEVLDIRGVYSSIHALNTEAAFFNRDENEVIEQKENGRLSVQNDVLNEKIQQVLESIENKMFEQAEKQLDNCYCEMMRENYNLRTVKSRAIDICFACRRGIEKEGLNDEQSRDAFPEYQAVTGSETAEQLWEALRGIIRTTAEFINSCNHAEYSPLVRSCLDYISRHYYEQINVGRIAEKLYVNKSYLGTLFKKETGASIVETITRYRMEKAIELMQNPQYKLFEISEKVGFDDPAYFTNVFTRYMGISPSAYRSSR